MKIEDWRGKSNRGESWKVKTENWKVKTERWKLKAESWKLKSENWKLKTENWKVKTESWKLKSENWKLKTESWKLKTENWKLKTERWKLKTELSVMCRCGTIADAIRGTFRCGSCLYIVRIVGGIEDLPPRRWGKWHVVPKGVFLFRFTVLLLFRSFLAYSLKLKAFSL